MGDYLLKHFESILQRNSVDNQFGLERVNLVELSETLSVVDKTQTLRRSTKNEPIFPAPKTNIRIIDTYLFIMSSC